MDYNFIAIEGNIGAGKTTLSRMLAEHYNAELLLENFEHNAFLPKFYAEPNRYALTVELSFLAERYHQLNYNQPGSNLFNALTISDYFISKSLIFARTNLQSDEFKLFWQLFDIMFHNVNKPDLLLYLYAPPEKLMQNIRKRGRRYEQAIKAEYLEDIQQQYLEFLRKQGNSMRIVLLDITNIDFVKKQAHFRKIVSLIELPLTKGVHNLSV